MQATGSSGLNINDEPTQGSTGMNGSVPADRTAPGQDARGPRLTVAALRRAIPVRMWGGKGCGAACDFCRVVVSESDVEYEIEADLDQQPVTLHFHPRCHDAWKAGLEPPREEPNTASPDTQQAAGSGAA
jgi:hypothetical protein